MHVLVQLHGQPGWVAALTPLSVDGMIVAASTTLLAESRSARRDGMLPWALSDQPGWRLEREPVQALPACDAKIGARGEP
jgi:hypothetical protein